MNADAPVVADRIIIVVKDIYPTGKTMSLNKKNMLPINGSDFLDQAVIKGFQLRNQIVKHGQCNWLVKKIVPGDDTAILPPTRHFLPEQNCPFLTLLIQEQVRLVIHAVITADRALTSAGGVHIHDYI